MARPRSELSAILHEFCSNVYFQPPSNLKLSFPCIIYKLDSFDDRAADNRDYLTMDEYSITYVTRDPDDPNIRAIKQLPYCSMTNNTTADNLRHYYYRLYF